MSLSMRAWLLCGLLAVVATAAAVSGSSLSAAASASASRTIGLGVLLDVGEGADQQLHSLDEFDAEPSLLQLQQEEAEASPEALHRLHGDAVAEQMEAAAADTGAADLALLEAAAQVDAQAETEAEAGSSKFEVFYFSPGPMLYDSGGGTTWKGYPFRVLNDAKAACAGIGARLATWAELTAAHAAGAEWCACGATGDNSWSYPMQTGRNGCGATRQVVRGCGGGGANCYGIKPKEGRMPGVHPFAPGKYHAPGVTPPPTPKGEPFYFSPGVMKYDSAGKTGTWQGYPFNKHSEAIAACAGIGARLATRAELDYAFYQNADWCACGALSDNSWSYPIQTPRNGCSAIRTVQRYCGGGGAVCFGDKPKQGTIPGVHPFSPSRYHAPLMHPRAATPASDLEVFVYNGKGPGRFNWNSSPGTAYPFNKLSEAAEACASIGSTLATAAQLDSAHALGAEWCFCAAVSSGQWSFPMHKISPGCGSTMSVFKGCTAGGATCYGRKPRKGSIKGLLPFNAASYHAPGVTPPGPPNYGDNEVFYYSPQPMKYDTAAGTSWKGYPFKTLQEAKVSCEAIGTRLATIVELEDAFAEGADWCACGAVEDGTWNYPIQTPRNGCAAARSIQRYCKSGGATCFGRKPRQGTIPGVHAFSPQRYHAPGRTAPPTPKTHNRQVFWFSPAGDAKKFDYSGNPGASYNYKNSEEDKARAACESVGAKLATAEQLKAAHMEGAQWCACGLVAGGKPTSFPMQEIRPGCGDRVGVISGCGAGGATCYGEKPKEGEIAGIAPFRPGQWLAPGSSVRRPAPTPKAPKTEVPPDVKPPPKPAIKKPSAPPAPVVTPVNKVAEKNKPKAKPQPPLKLAEPKPIESTADAAAKAAAKAAELKAAKKVFQEAVVRAPPKKIKAEPKAVSSSAGKNSKAAAAPAKPVPPPTPKPWAPAFPYEPHTNSIIFEVEDHGQI